MLKTFFGQCLYTSPSGYQVYQNYFYRWLTFGNDAYQTILNRKAPHQPVLKYLRPLTLMPRLNPGACCLLGLGGAAIPHWLNHLQPNNPMTVVDSSKEVIHIATHYFRVNELNALRVIHANAADFVKNHLETYDHVIVDLYGANHFPNECLNSDFFSNCKKILSPQGTLSVNLANLNEHALVFELIKEQFHFNTLVIPIEPSANLIIIAKHPDNYLMLNTINKSGELSRLAWTSSWGNVGNY